VNRLRQGGNPHPRRRGASPPGIGLPAWLDRSSLVLLTLLVASFVWAFWTTVLDLMKEWKTNEDYSVGQLVPLVALYLVWCDRRVLRDCTLSPCWWGLAIVVLGQIARIYGLLFVYESVERYALVLTLVGVVLLAFGWQISYRLRYVLLFLFLMVPFPGRIHNVISGPLQTLATAGAVFSLELFGVTVTREGNVILLNQTMPLAVAEACSGLRMLTAFVVVAATFAYVVKRPAWQKAVLVFSIIPFAIFCNLARLFVTANLYLVASSQVAERFFHDFAGLSMMPLAVLILAGELVIMNRLVVREPHTPR